MRMSVQSGAAILLAISLTTPAIGGEIKNTEEMKCPGDGTVYWARFDSKGGKYDTGSKACKKGETVKVPLEDNGGAKAIGFFQAGTKLPDPLAVEYFMTPAAFGVAVLGERAVVLRHAVPNALLPIVAMIGIDIGQFMGGQASLIGKVTDRYGLGAGGKGRHMLVQRDLSDTDKRDFHQWLSFPTSRPRQPFRKSKSAPVSAPSTCSWKSCA